MCAADHTFLSGSQPVVKSQRNPGMKEGGPELRAGGMEQQVKAFASTPDHLSVIAGIHMMEGET